MMSKLISIDPGKCKCGLVLVDLDQKRVDQAVVLNTEFLAEYVKNLNSYENISKVLNSPRRMSSLPPCSNHLLIRVW